MKSTKPRDEGASGDIYITDNVQWQSVEGNDDREED